MNNADKLKKAQLMIAKEIKRICEENNIIYFLDAGSMLGAVRHGGFIPWDDDMDIGMPYNEYQKFLEIAPKKLKKEFFLDNYELDKEYGLVFSKVRLKDTLYREKICSTNNEHLEIFVDVFPYFLRPKNKYKRKIQSIKLRIYSQIFMAQSGFHVWDGNKGFLKLKFIPIRILSKVHKKDYIYNKIKKNYKQDDQSNIICIHDGISYNYWYYDKEYLNEFINIKFENKTFKIPKMYDKILSKVYGDYMKLPDEKI